MFPAFKGSPTARSAASQAAWNQNVARAPIDPNSSDYVARITALGGNQVVHPDFGGNGSYGIPYTTVGRGQRRVRVRVTAYPGESDFGRAPIPPGAPVESGSDRHVLVLQRQRCDLFELFDARYVGGPGHRWRAASTARFDLRSRGLREDGWTSADAAGLPILPGLVRPGEVRRGHVRHAIRATFAETRRAYIHPATHYASSQCHPDLPPMGLRLRLQALVLPAQPAPLSPRQPVAGDLQGPIPLRDHQRGQRRQRLELVHHGRPLEALERRRPEPPQDGSRHRLRGGRFAGADPDAVLSATRT